MAYSPSEKYPGAVDVDPDYQGGKFRDNNPSTTNNGSPLKAIDRNELLARDEAIMNDAGFEYSGVADTPQDSQLFKAYKASLGNGANLLSNHNFLIQTPDDSQPLPSATPTSYPPGHQIFSGVFANETTGITNLTYIDGRVSFSGGDLYFSVPNTGAIARLTSDQLTASVADFDGKPRTRGVSFSLVGDDYRVTVGIDALEDASANSTPLGSVKFEQGIVATGHNTQSSKGEAYSFNSVQDVIDNIPQIGSKVAVEDYIGGATPNGSGYLFFKVVPAGTGAADGGRYIDVPGGVYQLEQIMKIKVDMKDYGAIAGIDQTALIQTVSDNNDYMQISSDYLIEAIPGFRPKAGKTIEFVGGAKLSVITQNFGAYQALMVLDADSVDIINPRVIGDRVSNASLTGEWGHCIAVIGSSNVNIYSAYTQDGFGDGIYIGKNYSDDGSTFITSPNENVNVNFHGKTVCHNNRRDNISVITGDVTFGELTLTKDITGIAPDAGFNIEPNTASEPLNVTTGKITTSGHQGSGVTIGLRNFNELTPFFNIDIAEISSSDDRDFNLSTPGEAHGSIVIGNAVISSAKKNGFKGEKLDNAGGMSILINSLKLVGCNTSGDASTRDGSAVSIRRNTSLTTHPLGGVNINHLYIDSPDSTNGVYFNDESATAIAEAPLVIGNLEKINTQGFAISSSSAVVVNDPNEILTKNLEPAESATYSYSTSDYKRLIRTHSTKGTIIELPQINPGEYKGLQLRVIFRAQGFTQRVKPSGTNRIAFDGQVAGKGLDVATEGATLDLRWNGSAEWEILNLNGDFTKEA
ncbi:hypothetical protein NVP1100O_38 [Vibrio phage 1.100.O._10N.261.45.C3]|nr:hypothetical protein NVP1100O_38 [Vibrio phage 1.100.O._10N.261.45.C3]